MGLTQGKFIHDFADSTSEHFNKEIFTRSDDKIIDSLENIILSCERDGIIVIKVKKFEVIEDYHEVRETLRRYEDYRLKKAASKNKGPQENRYVYIDLKNSDLKILKVTYHIAAPDRDLTQEETENLPLEEWPKKEKDLIVFIAVPKVINKFYFRLNGSIYSAIYQIVDASTYNTSTSKSSTKHFITLKTIFQPIRIFRNINKIRTTKKEEVDCCTYDNNTFKKSVSAMLYFLAKFGFIEGMKFVGVYGAITITEEDPDDEQCYTFKPKKTTEVYINVPKMLFDKNRVLQHVVYTLILAVKRGATYQDLFRTDYWLTFLGIVFGNQTNPIEKGRNVLRSLEFIYDLETKNEIHLPEEYKHDVYCILRWMIWEYNNLRIKDNLNILTKKLRCSEYIAAIYGAKLSKGIYKISDREKKADLKTITKFLATYPLYLIDKMTSNQLINFNNMVTDMDSLLAMKFTYKGKEAGINTISNDYKLIHPSNLGVLDMDASSPSDPGVSGSIAPLAKLYNGYFSEFQEPITWEKSYADLFNTYKEASGKVEVLDFRKKILHDKAIRNREIIEAEKTASTARKLVKAIHNAEKDSEYGGLPLEGSGRIQYE